MNSREGDLLEIHNGLIFDVKGLVHPPSRIVAFPRFVPNPHGNRKRGGITYIKIYALSERYKFLEERFPPYLVFDSVFGERLCEVPKEDVRRCYNPIEHLRQLRHDDQLDELEADALRFLELLHNHSNIPWSKLGISGSLLAELHTPESDIDPAVYGEKNCRKVYEALKSIMKDEKSDIRAYSLEELQTLYDFRSQDTEIPLADFVKTERRKALQGKFLHHDFFIRCVKDWNEVEEYYGDVIYRRVGYAKIRATVLDASEAIFTPCRYSVANVQQLEGECGEAVTEIASFRGRFCEQAKEGESVVAQGKVEKIQKRNGHTFFRLLLGGNLSDFMALEG